jgi:hypothetical protein
MAYQINRFDNSVLTTVQDGTINSVTDLKFVGRNFAGYGEIQNENFLFLLENFAGLNPPPKALNGQIWYDTGLQKLKFYDGSRWRATGGAEVQSNQPSGLTEGDFWWDSSNEQLYVFNGLGFVLIGPQNAGDGTTQLVSTQVLDTNNNLRTIIQGIVSDEVVFVIYNRPSEDANPFFDLSPSNPITGFDRIRAGLTLIDTENSKNGVTSSEYRYWGTASNADTLGGVALEEFTLKNEAVFENRVDFSDNGIAIGESLGFKLFVKDALDGVIQNENGPQSEIHFITNNNTETPVHSVTINNTGMIPPQNNFYQIGAPNNIWKEVHAAQFIGESTRARQLLVLDNNSFVSGRITATANTAAVRDSSGNLNAVLFQGTATQARYADLAEKYTTKTDWPVGTVVSVCECIDHEVCPANKNDLIVGVVSMNPAYLMNADAPGQAIALEGRVPVRVFGAVSKGDIVYVSRDGVCSTKVNQARVGIALESNVNEGEKLVECIIKT